MRLTVLFLILFSFLSLQATTVDPSCNDPGPITNVSEHLSIVSASQLSQKISQCTKQSLASDKQITDCVQDILLGIFRDGLGGTVATLGSFVKESGRLSISVRPGGAWVLGLFGIESTQEKIQDLVEQWGPDAVHIAKAIQSFISDQEYRDSLVKNLVPLVTGILAEVSTDFMNMSCSDMAQKICTIMGEMTFEVATSLIASIVTAGVGTGYVFSKLLVTLSNKAPRLAKVLEKFVDSLKHHPHTNPNSSITKSSLPPDTNHTSPVPASHPKDSLFAYPKDAKIDVRMKAVPYGTQYSIEIHNKEGKKVGSLGAEVSEETGNLKLNTIQLPVNRDERDGTYSRALYQKLFDSIKSQGTDIKTISMIPSQDNRDIYIRLREKGLSHTDALKRTPAYMAAQKFGFKKIITTQEPELIGGRWTLGTIIFGRE